MKNNLYIIEYYDSEGECRATWVVATSDKEANTTAYKHLKEEYGLTDDDEFEMNIKFIYKVTYAFNKHNKPYEVIVKHSLKL